VTVVRIGPAGWSYKDWEGIVYPQPRPRGFHGAEYLAQFFNTIEVNSSFYGAPTATVTSEWVKRVEHNPDFKFTVKLWRGFTHERNASSEDEKTFKAGMAPVLEAERLGALLLQFPWSFKNTPDDREYLIQLHSRFSSFPLVLEVRHRSWNDPALLDTLAAMRIGFCNIDQPHIGRSLRATAETTSSVGYIRLHGRNYQNWFAENKKPSDRYDYLYSVKELEPWVERVKTVSSRAAETYVVTNNHYLGKAVVNAFELTALVTGEPVETPEQLVQHYPRLKAVSSSHKQSSGRHSETGGGK